MARKGGSKPRAKGTVVGGITFGSRKGRVQMKGSGIPLGQLRQEFKHAVKVQNPLGVSGALLMKPTKATSTVRSIKSGAKFNGVHARTAAISQAVGHRAYSRVYKLANKGGR